MLASHGRFSRSAVIVAFVCGGLAWAGVCAAGDAAPATDPGEASRDLSAVPADYEPLSSAPEYLPHGLNAAKLAFERGVTWPVVEPALPEGAVARARAIELYELALRATATDYAQWMNDRVAADWWSRLERSGWSHPYMTTVWFRALLEETPGGRSTTDVIRAGRAAVDALFEDAAYASLPSYRRALAAWSLADQLDERPSYREEAVAYRAMGDGAMIESLQSTRPAAERMYAMEKTAFRFDIRAQLPWARRFVAALGASDDPDPYAFAYLKGMEQVELAWEARGRAPGRFVTDEGWQGFNEHLAEADRALRAAYTIDERYASAPRKMIRLAMAGRAGAGNDPRVWHSVVLSWTPTDSQTWHDLSYALTPRWGGSIGEMLEVAFAAGEHGVRVPQMAWRVGPLLASVSEELDTRWRVWEIPGVWPRVRASLEASLEAGGDPAAGEFRAMQEFERLRVLSVLTIGAWCNGEFELAESYYNANSWALAYRDTNAFGLDRTLIVDSMSALDTNGREHVLEALKHQHNGRHAAATAAWERALAASVGHADARYVHDEMVQFHARSSALAALERGDWADLRFLDHHALGFGWSELPTYNFGREPDVVGDALVAHRRSDGTSRLTYRIPTGDRFEVEATLEPVVVDGEPLALGRVGLAVMIRWPFQNSSHWTLELDHNGESASFGWASRGDIARVELAPGQAVSGPVTLRFRREGRLLSAWVNDELLHSQVADPGWDLGEYVGIVTRSTHTASPAARITSIRMRRVPEEAPGGMPDF